MPSRGLGRICSPLSAHNKMLQNEIQNRGKIAKTHPETYICVLASRVDVWPRTTLQYPPKCKLYGPLGWLQITTRPRQQRSCMDETNVGWNKTNRNKQRPWHQPFQPPTEPKIITTLAPKNKFRHQHHIWTIVPEPYRLLQTSTWCAGRKRGIGPKQKTNQQKSTNSPKQCSINIAHETNVHKHAVTRVGSDLFPFTRSWHNPPKRITISRKSQKKTFWNVYLCSGNARGFLALDCVTRPSESNSTDHVDKRAQRPTCRNNNLAFLDIKLDKETARNQQQSVTLKCSPANPKCQIATTLAPINYPRHRRHLWKTCSRPRRLLQTSTWPAGRKLGMFTKPTTNQQKSTNSPKPCSTNICHETNVPKHAVTRFGPDLFPSICS